VSQARQVRAEARGSAGYDATMGICTLKDGPIHTVKDLEGHKLASTVSSGDYPFLSVFAERAGLDLNKVARTQADPNVRQRLLISKEVDAISGFAISFVPVFESQHVETRNLLFSSHGLTLYNNSLLTQTAMLEKEPKLCADMAAGLAEALKFTMLSPDEAVKTFLKEVPEVALTAEGADRTRLGIGIFNVSMLYPALKEHSVGYAVPDDYAGMTDLTLFQSGATLAAASSHGCPAHMTYLEAGVVGIIQGVTELFPVSSLGHNVLLPALVGGCWAHDLNVAANESPYLAFIVGLHVATAIALLIYFWKDWVRIIGGFFSSLGHFARPEPFERSCAR